MRSRRVCLSLALGLAFCAGALAWDEKPAELKMRPVVVVDAKGKEQKLTRYQFTAGIRRLGWLAAEQPSTDKTGKGKGRPTAPQGPEALVIRDDTTIHFLSGVVTLIPLPRIRSIQFDADKRLMTVAVAVSAKPEEDVKLSGSSKFKGVNKLTLEAEVDKGDAGVAEVSYQGGILRGGIQSVQFSSATPEAFKPGRPAVVVSLDDTVRKVHKVSDLQALYQLPSGREKLLPVLMFKKTLKLDLAKIKSVQLTSDKDSETPVWQVVQKDGEASSLTPLGSLPIDKQTGTLVGLVGRVPVGYKLFPLRRIKVIAFDTSEEPKDEDKVKPKDDE